MSAEQRPSSGTAASGGGARLAGLALTLGLVAGLVGGLVTDLSQLYLRWGMYGLFARTLQGSVNLAIGVALLAAALVVLAGRLARRRLAPGAGWRWAGAASLAITLLLNGYVLARGLAGGDGPNLVLIGVDTLRADHLGLYGYQRDTSPRIDAWAEGATVFDNCIAAIPRTTQSLASILTGKYPHRIGVRYLNDELPARELSLAEVMRDAGYRTIAVIATGIPYQKLDQGFDVVIDTKQEFSAEEAVDRAIAALAATRGKYFLFIFFRDPHMPYRPPELAFDSDYRGPFREGLDYAGKKAEVVFKNSFDDALREHAVALYDSEIRYLDRQFGRLMETVESRSADNVVLFFADHGESLGEHDYYYDHGDLLHQPGLRIPCVIEGIDFAERRVGEVVRGVDLMPTVLARLGLGIRDDEFDGVDLAAEHPPLEAFSETGRALLETAFETGRRHASGLQGRLRSLISGEMKLIYVPRGRSRFDFELYDLSRDPLELDDLSDTIEADSLKRRLLRWVNEDRDNWDKPEEELSEREAERLRRLGYL